MNNRKRQLVIIVLVVVAVIGLILNLAGFGLVWWLNRPLTEFGVGLLEYTEAAAGAVESILPPVSNVLEQVQQPVENAASAAGELAQTTAEQGVVLQLLPDSMTERLSAALAELQDIYARLSEAISSLNQTLVALNALPFVSVPTLADTDLPERFASLQGQVQDLRAAVGDARAGVSGRIDDVAERAQAAAQTIEGWQSSLEETEQRLENIQTRLEYLEEQLPLWIDLGGIFLSLLLLSGVISQAAVLVLARSLYKNTRLQLQPGVVLGEEPTATEPEPGAL